MEENNENRVSIPFIMDYMGATNRRMFHALLAVCATFILTIIIFVVGYTIRERNWLNTIRDITPTVEVADGIYEQPNP